MRNDIIWGATLREFKINIIDRRDHAQASLNTLKNQDGLFAEEHRRVIMMYDDVLCIVGDYEDWTDRNALAKRRAYRRTE